MAKSSKSKKAKTSSALAGTLSAFNQARTQDDQPNESEPVAKMVNQTDQPTEAEATTETEQPAADSAEVADQHPPAPTVESSIEESKPQPEPKPEPTVESSVEETEPQPEPKPEPTVEPSFEETEPQPEPTVESSIEETKPEPEPKPEPTVEPSIEESKPEPEPKPTVESSIEETKPQPEPKLEPTVEPSVEESKPEPEPTVESSIEESKPEPEPTVEPSIEESKPEPEPTRTTAQMPLKLTFWTRIQRRMSRLLGRRLVRTEGNLAVTKHKLKQWLQTVSEAVREANPQQAQTIAQLRDDLGPLSEMAFARLQRNLTDYCAAQGHDLSQLMTHPGAVKPSVEVVSQFVVWYQAAKSITFQRDLLHEYLMWQQNLSQAQYRNINYWLLEMLEQQGLTPPPPVEVYLATESTRRAYAEQLLRDVAHHHPTAFLSALAKTL